MRSHLRILAVAAGIGLLPATAQDGGPTSPSILVIDREAVLLGSQTGRARLAELADDERALATENRTIEAELTQEEASLAERRTDMDPGAFRSEADAFDRRVTAIRETQDAKERVLIERRQRLLDALRQEMLPILGEIMEERSATVMLDRDAILIFAANADITEEVIRRLDERSAATGGPGEGTAPADRGPAEAEAAPEE